MTEDLKNMLDTHYSQIRDCLKSIKDQMGRVEDKIDQHARDIIEVKKDCEYLRKEFEDHKSGDKRDKDNIWTRIRENEGRAGQIVDEKIDTATVKIKNWVYVSIGGALVTVAGIIINKFF